MKLRTTSEIRSLPTSNDSPSPNDIVISKSPANPNKIIKSSITSAKSPSTSKSSTPVSFSIDHNNSKEVTKK